MPYGLSVIENLRNAVPPEWQVILMAIDGNETLDVLNRGVPKTAAHLVIGVGGNDAIGFLPMLDQKVNKIGATLLHLGKCEKLFAGVTATCFKMP